MTRLAIIKPANRFNKFKDETIELKTIEFYEPIKIYNHYKGTFRDRRPTEKCLITITDNSGNYSFTLACNPCDDYAASTCYTTIKDLDSNWRFTITPNTCLAEFLNIKTELDVLIHNHNIEQVLKNI